MPQDAFTLRYLCEELSSIFTGGKVNKITQPSCDETLLTIYTGKRTEKLLLDVNPGGPRIGVINEEKDSPLTAPNFCMLMRKHLLSATVTGISLIGFDRIVKIDFLSSQEFFDATEKSLYVELMGRYSNIILTENGKILGGNRGINMFDDGVRPLIVGRPYVFPPVGEKKLPTDTALIELFKKTEIEDLVGVICSNVQGVATSTANEIVLSYLSIFGEKKCENFGEKFFECLNKFLYHTDKKPCVITDGENVKDVCVYPYQTASGVVKIFEKLYLAEEYYFKEKEKQKQYKNQKERLTSITQSAIKKVKKKLTAITAKQRDAKEAETNKLKGELILANLYRIKNGDSECELDNYYDGSKVKIALDERFSPAKNAEVYYKKYNKQKRTLDALKPQSEQAEKELDYLNSVFDEIVLSETIDDLYFVRKELETSGFIKAQKNTAKKKKEQETFCREYDVFGFKVRVGRNNSENDKLTFTSKAEDVWVHVKDYHSSHVVIESEGREVPERVIRISAEICAYYSKCREGGKAEVVYTEKKHVKKPPKSKLGFCSYDNFKSIMVEPQKRTEFLKSD